MGYTMVYPEGRFVLVVIYTEEHPQYYHRGIICPIPNSLGKKSPF